MDGFLYGSECPWFLSLRRVRSSFLRGHSSNPASLEQGGQVRLFRLCTVNLAARVCPGTGMSPQGDGYLFLTCIKAYVSQWLCFFSSKFILRERERERHDLGRNQEPDAPLTGSPGAPVVAVLYVSAGRVAQGAEARNV